ncbi:MAG: glycine zipper domain-containing protein [Lacipirellulaceae bacterium]
MKAKTLVLLALTACGLAASGCRSPYYADKGAGLGALVGAGAGALVADATGGQAESGALIGAGLGAITGATVGDSMDQMQAENRAAIAAQLGRQVPAGAATIDEVVAMSQQGVDPRLISNYIKTSGVAAPPSAADVIYMHNNGVATDVIQTMQNPPAPQAVAAAPAQPVIVEEHYYEPAFYGPPPCYGPRHRYGYRHRPRGGVSWGVSITK